MKTCMGPIALSIAVVAAIRTYGEVPRVPCRWSWDDLTNSLVDLSGFLEAPAGARGFVREHDGHLVDGAGRRVRIWGVNLTGNACFLDKASAERLAAQLAQLGVNAVRLHGMDGWSPLIPPNATTSRELNPEALDQLDYLIACFKARGIYVNLNLNVARRFRVGDGVRDADQLGYAKSATYFNPRLIELQYEYARQLLTHSNPYTRSEYRYEPAVITVEIVNENSLLEGWVSGRLVGAVVTNPFTWSPLPHSYAEELTRLYNEWLAAHRPPEVLAALRSEASVPADARIPRLAPSEFAKASALRFRTEAEFYFDLERRFFADMKRFLRDELGVRSAIVGTSDHNDRFAAYAHVVANAQLDWIDGHGYWQHPNTRSKPPTCQNTPMANDPFDSTVVQFARTPVVGRAFTISEVNHPFPHEYACEGFAILTAYAMFQDWDGIYWYTWSHGRAPSRDGGIPQGSFFDLSVDPMKVANLIACAAAWHIRSVAPARRTIVRRHGPVDMLEALRMAKTESPFFMPGFPRATPLLHATRWRWDDGPTNAPPTPPAAAQLESDTGELRWLRADVGRGVVLADTPSLQVVAGFMDDSLPPLRHLRLDVQNTFGTVVLVPLDREPIARSRRLLLAATSWCGNTDMRWDEKRRALLEWGRGPVLIEPIVGQIQLRDMAPGRVRATPLSPVGAPVGDYLPVRHTEQEAFLLLGDPPALLFLIEVLSPQGGGGQ